MNKVNFCVGIFGFKFDEFIYLFLIPVSVFVKSISFNRSRFFSFQLQTNFDVKSLLLMFLIVWVSLTGIATHYHIYGSMYDLVFLCLSITVKQIFLHIYDNSILYIVYKSLNINDTNFTIHFTLYLAAVTYILDGFMIFTLF